MINGTRAAVIVILVVLGIVLATTSLGSRIAVTLGLITPARQDSGVVVAVAANFAVPLQALIARFESENPQYHVTETPGASGALLTQIQNGNAALQIFLSADNSFNRQAISSGLGVAGSDFVYAIGQLALWSKTTDLFDAEGKAVGATAAGASILDQTVLCNAATNANLKGCIAPAPLAVANPALAPYGVAAQQTLQKLGYYGYYFTGDGAVSDPVTSHAATFSSITNTYNAVESGAATMGFVARSALIAAPGNPPGVATSGSTWIVPENLHAPIEQGAVLLKSGADSPAAQAFYAYLKSAEARAIMAGYGYH